MEELMNEIKDVLDAERLITARLVESVTKTAQLAGGATPEMQELFGQWVSLISAQILREHAKNEKNEINIPELSNKIGIKETSLLSLLLAMQRNGELRVQNVTFSKEPSEEHEICACLREK